MRRFEQFSNNVISLLLRKFGHRRNYRNKTIFHFSSLTCIGLQDEWSNSCWQATLSKSHLNSSQENRFHLANSLGERNARWMTKRPLLLKCSYTFVPSLPFFFIRHTRTRWRNVMEKPFECIMCTANGLQKTCSQNTISATIILLCPVKFK